MLPSFNLSNAVSRLDLLSAGFSETNVVPTWLVNLTLVIVFVMSTGISGCLINPKLNPSNFCVLFSSL